MKSREEVDILPSERIAAVESARVSVDERKTRLREKDEVIAGMKFRERGIAFARSEAETGAADEGSKSSREFNAGQVDIEAIAPGVLVVRRANVRARGVEINLTG